MNFKTHKHKLYQVLKPKKYNGFVMRTWSTEELEIAKSAYFGDSKVDENEIQLFHDEFNEWQGSKHSFSFQNGRSALSFVLDVLSIEAGDEIVLSPYCCVVVYNAVLYAKATPILCDIELDSLSLGFDEVIQKVTPATKAIIIPHIMGFVARDIRRIKNFCKEQGIYLIEDCAQAQGAAYEDVKVGNFGDASIFSFENSKGMSTINGGMAVLNKNALASIGAKMYNKLNFCSDDFERAILEYGLVKYYSIVKNQNPPFPRCNPSFKSTLPEELRFQKPANYGGRMNPIFAQLGRTQLRKVDYFNNKRRNAVKYWKKKFDNELSFVQAQKKSQSMYLRLPAMLSNQCHDKLEFNIKYAKVGYWYSTLLDPADVKLEGFPRAKLAIKRIVNLPTLF